LSQSTFPLSSALCTPRAPLGLSIQTVSRTLAKIAETERQGVSGISLNIEAVFPRIHRCGELWCGDILPISELCKVTPGTKRKEKPKPTEGSSVRATISFPSDVYQTLEDIARQKKVSLAWVVREATEQYIADKWPLLTPRKGA
jgi:hypothetical protein